jgi:predicted Zn-dependent protease
VYYERALAIAPGNAVANNNLAYVLAQTNTNLDAALTHAERAKAAAPDNPDFTDTLGIVYLKRGLHENAVEVLRAIVIQNPSRVPFRYHYAQALVASGKPEEAKKELETALDSRPSVEEERQIRQLLGEIGSS